VHREKPFPSRQLAYGRIALDSAGVAPGQAFDRDGSRFSPGTNAFDRFAQDSLARYVFLLLACPFLWKSDIGGCQPTEILADDRLTDFWDPLRATKATLWAHHFRPGRRRAIYGQLRLDPDFVPKLVPESQFDRDRHALNVFLWNWLKTSGQDHTLNQVPAPMEFKWKAVIQYFRF
jgi:hypothetical protein